MAVNVFADSPKNHHYILEFLKKMPETSLIRLDNHEDLIRSGFGYSLPCANYMNKVFMNDYFESVLWVRKNSDYAIRKYKGKNDFLDCHVSSAQKMLEFCLGNSCEKIVLDIDPDILWDYETGFSKGSMEKSDLKKTVEFFLKNRKVELLFLAESKEFLDDLLKNGADNAKHELYPYCEH